MKITFRINYRTSWGETLCISGSVPALGSGKHEKAVAMRMTGPETWEATIDFPDRVKNFTYSYLVKTDGSRPWRFEWGQPHSFSRGEGVSKYLLLDSWQEIPPNKPFYSSAFTDGLLARGERQAPLSTTPDSLTIKVFAPMIRPDETLGISGSNNSFGNWDASRCLKMSDAAFPEWEVQVPLDGLEIPFNFKFVILDRKTGELISWENGKNRIFDITPQGEGEAVILSGLRFTNAPKAWKGAGTAIPVFSIRTEKGYGVGDFSDLIPMIDWCAATNQCVLQLLPVNDTTMTGTWTDSYPYNGNSTMALHPMYVGLEDAGLLEDKKRMKYYDDLRHNLNELPEVDYEEVNRVKHSYMKELFDQDFKSLSKKKIYKDFRKANDSWLTPYAAFSILRDIYGTADMQKWGEHSVYTPELAEKVCAEHQEESDLVRFIQYHLDRQLLKARDYAHSKRVVMKGDIPIGISRTSVDAWMHPRLFNLGCQAGAPPDAFSVMGQNWGFPTYNWEEMAHDGFEWWKTRFRKMATYFDAYRIDHILGFFRIWQIPGDALHGLLGYFNPALPFSPDELREQYNFYIRPEVHTKPFIMRWMLNDFFGDDADEAASLFLEPIDSERFRLKEFVNTQRKVADYFAQQEKNEKNERRCNCLLSLIDDVLFIEDPYKPGHYHPRISAQYTYQYRSLSDYEKWTFDHLYNEFFYRRHNEFWKGKAMWKLPPLLECNRMLTCAEDLGMIPDCVPSVMHSLQILSLEIQRMPKDPHVEFANTAAYPYFSVCTTSTHDMPGIRGWWEEDRAASQRYYNNVLGLEGQAPYFADPWICTLILDRQLSSPSMLCILPLQDWLSTDGRLRRENPGDEVINVPANPKHYWRYRMHLTVEELLANKEFNDSVKGLIGRHGR